MITRSYDAVVVYPSPGAFTAAAMLAAGGRQVLVVEHPRDAATAGRYQFPAHRRILAGIGGGIWLPGALREIQVHPRDIQAMQRSKPLYQVVDPDHRVDFPPEPEALGAELTREFGPRAAAAATNLLSRVEEAATRHAEAINASLAEQTQVGFWSKIGMKKLGWSEPSEDEDTAVSLRWAAEQEQVDTRLLAFVAAPLFLQSGVADPLDQLTLGRAGLLLMGALDGLYQDPGNPDAFESLFRRRVEGIKVDITATDTPEELVFGWGRLKEIRFAGREQPVRAESLITGDDPRLLARWIQGSAAEQYSGSSVGPEPSHFLHSLRLGVAEDVIPEGMCDHVFLVGDEDEAAPACVLASLTPEGSGGAPKGRRAMTVSCRLPLGLVDDAHKLDQASTAMLDRVKRLMPYLERYIEVIHLPQTGERSAANPFPVDPRPVAYATDDDGPRRAAALTLPHRNVFYCGRGSLPWLGLDGEVMAGMAVARLAAHVIRKGK